MYATASTHGLLRLVAVLSTRHPIVTIALLGPFLAEAVDRRQGIHHPAQAARPRGFEPLTFGSVGRGLCPLIWL
jgi:hypothetical protein